MVSLLCSHIILGATAIGGGFFTSSLNAVITMVNCRGNETQLSDCPFMNVTTFCSHDAGIVCQGEL